jgi:predicted ATPase
MKLRVTKLRVENFKALADAWLPLDGLTCLVGRNGVGKSGILDAVAFLSELMTDTLANAFLRRGGVASVVRTGTPAGESMTLGLEMVGQVGGEDIAVQYSVSYLPTEHKVREYLRVEPQEALGFRWNGSKFESSAPLSLMAAAEPYLALPLVGQANGLWGAVAAAVRDLRSYEFSTHLMADPGPVQGMVGLHRHGRNLADVVAKMRATPEFSRLLALVGSVTPKVVDLEVKQVLRNRVLAFVQQQAGGRVSFDASQVSAGELRATAIFAALLQQPEPSALFIDELEQSLDSNACASVIAAMALLSQRLPVVVTTHSAEVLNYPEFSVDRTFVVSMRGGVASIHPIGSGSRASLDEFTAMGHADEASLPPRAGATATGHPHRILSGSTNG